MLPAALAGMLVRTSTPDQSSLSWKVVVLPGKRHAFDAQCHVVGHNSQPFSKSYLVPLSGSHQRDARVGEDEATANGSEKITTQRTVDIDKARTSTTFEQSRQRSSGISGGAEAIGAIPSLIEDIWKRSPPTEAIAVKCRSA